MKAVTSFLFALAFLLSTTETHAQQDDKYNNLFRMFNGSNIEVITDNGSGNNWKNYTSEDLHFCTNGSVIRHKTEIQGHTVSPYSGDNTVSSNRKTEVGKWKLVEYIKNYYSIEIKWNQPIEMALFTIYPETSYLIDIKDGQINLGGMYSITRYKGKAQCH